MHNIRNWVISLAIMISAGGALFALATPQAVGAVGCEDKVLLLPSWCRGLKTTTDKDNKTTIDSPDSSQLTNFIWHIVLNIIEMGLVLVGYIAAAFILYGGVQYILTQGVVEGAVKARSTILNGIIGLIISMISASIVGLVVTRIMPKMTYVENADEVLNGVLNIVYLASGAFAVIIIILAGFSYTTANGEPDKIAKAKKAIMYSVIGIVVVLIAFIITQFVIGRMGR